MSTSKDIPTYDSLRSSGTIVLSSMDMLRVRLSLFGPLESSIEVADTLDQDSKCEPYTTDGHSFHKISTSPATEPPVSSISVNVDDLDTWGYRWEGEHRDDNWDNQEWTGDSDDEDRDLLRCCGIACPPPPPSLEVLPTTHPFVTVHDYITQVHAWLQTLKPSILAAIDGLSSPSTRLYSSFVILRVLMFEEETRAGRLWESVERHVRRHRGGTTRS
ncbi:hypothetical protein BKA58DRAFT_242099 [Alternaria rosae]|uniref:uncharacterized protein n=1 Tax=Alternaria rosae TaxID=1187941 RepID=UPI001E8DBFAC|nr:uncharacterized protein BKA58DRAFT_242099 [Alternaria rosae]KAH6865255.1 hypothetical protein BKA58DRAFT_242099 [Alternaria rosae]